MAPLYYGGLLLALVGLQGDLSEAGKVLRFSDEFGTFDSSTWTREVLPYTVNQELQTYTTDPANSNVANGVMSVTAIAQSGGGYTSARLSTQGKMVLNYGTVEVEARLPFGRGTWPGIWMLSDQEPHGSWPRSGEMDIMEHVGFNMDVVKSGIHCDESNFRKFWVDREGVEQNGDVDLSNVDTEYHTYRLQWTPDGITFSVDDLPPHIYYNNDRLGDKDTWPFDDGNDFYLIMNLAIGGGWGGLQGIDESVFPSTMTVRSVRVFEPPIYKRGPNLLANPDFENGLSGWNTYTGPVSGASSIRMEGDQVRFFINVAGEGWHSQLSQQQWANEGQQFWLSFWVKKVWNGDLRTAQAYIQQSGGSWTNFGRSTCSVTFDSWSRCSVSGVITDASRPINFGIAAGANTDHMLVDSALLVTNNLLDNPNFSEGLQDWSTYVHSDVGAVLSSPNQLNFFISDLGAAPVTWKVAAYQTLYNVRQGERFTLSVELWTITSGSERSVTLYIQQSGSPYIPFGQTVCTVVNTRSRCSVTGTVWDTSRPVKFGVSGGDSLRDFAMDNAILSQHYE